MESINDFEFNKRDLHFRQKLWYNYEKQRLLF